MTGSEEQTFPFQIFICLMENGFWNYICIPISNEDEYLKKTKQEIYCKNSWSHKKCIQCWEENEKAFCVEELFGADFFF